MCVAMIVELGTCDLETVLEILAFDVQFCLLNILVMIMNYWVSLLSLSSW